MATKRSNILIFILILLSAALIAAFYFRESFHIQLDYLFYSIIGYALITIIFSFIFKAQLAKKAKQKDVQIIYKEVEVAPKNVKKNEKKIDSQETDFINFFKNIPTFETKEKYAEEILRRFAKEMDIVVGLFYIWDEDKKYYYIINTFAYYSENTDKKFELGEGITGQVAKNQTNLIINNVPEGYIDVASGLGKSNPKNLAFIPIIRKKKTIGVIEIASFENFPENADEVFTKIAKRISDDLNKFID